MTPSLTDVDLYLTVGRRLLGQTVTPYFMSNIAALDIILQNIAAASFVKGAAPLFDDGKRLVDYSQFTPRGHYTRSETFKRYFQAMMWLGRTEFYLSPPRNTSEKYTDAEIQRQTVAALLVMEAVQLAGETTELGDIDAILRFFVGESDNVTLSCLSGLMTELGLNNAGQLIDSTQCKNFQSGLLVHGWAYERILSQMLCSGGFLAIDQIQPASSFLLMGQRFVIDSYVTGGVVFDKIIYQNTQVRRMLPSTLDVLFALGNDAAGQLLVPELDRFHYATNLAALRYLVDSYEPQFWRNTIYNGWLNAIRALNPPEERGALPAFMQTAAWWQEKMNSQLSSWAQLRHDNLLYAKQSYTGMPICSYPFSYVEPIPKFFHAVAALADTAAAYFSQSSVPEMKPAVDYFANLKYTADTLSDIAEKELSGATLNQVEKNFLGRMMFQSNGGCMQVPDGWYAHLFYGGVMGSTREDQVVADVHTSPADESGAIVGWVLHGGTRLVDMAFVVTDVPGAGSAAFVGPVMSYYEYVTTNFKRLTDEEWKADYAATKASRPSLVNLYLADQYGKSRGTGLTLLTGVRIDQGGGAVPGSIWLDQNYPNPFNSSTLIPLVVPQGEGYSQVELSVYDIQGRRVRQLVNQQLPAGSYIITWDGRSSDGHSVASGIYVSQLKAKGGIQARKMVVIR